MALLAAVTAVDTVLGEELSPSCANAAATAEASRLAFWFEESVEAITAGAVNSLSSLL